MVGPCSFLVRCSYPARDMDTVEAVLASEPERAQKILAADQAFFRQCCPALGMNRCGPLVTNVWNWHRAAPGAGYASRTVAKLCPDGTRTCRDPVDDPKLTPLRATFRRLLGIAIRRALRLAGSSTVMHLDRDPLTVLMAPTAHYLITKMHIDRISLPGIGEVGALAARAAAAWQIVETNPHR